VQTAWAADDDRVDAAKEEPPRRRRAARLCLRRTAGGHRSPLPASLFFLLLRERDRFLCRSGQLEFGEDRAVGAVRVRGGAAGCAVPHRRRD
jgi:hypothetical protein